MNTKFKKYIYTLAKDIDKYYKLYSLETDLVKKEQLREEYNFKYQEILNLIYGKLNLVLRDILKNEDEDEKAKKLIEYDKLLEEFLEIFDEV